MTSKSWIAHCILFSLLLLLLVKCQSADEKINLNLEISKENITAVFDDLTANVTKFEFYFGNSLKVHNSPTCLIPFDGNVFPLFGVADLDYGDYVSFHSNEIVHSECTIFGAGAYVGKGRALVFTHPAYVTYISQFESNLKDWATRGAKLSSDQIYSMNEFTDEDLLKADLGPIKLIWWTMSFNRTMSDAVQDKIIDFLEKGGALILGASGGMLQDLSVPGPASEIPVNRLLLKLGMIITRQLLTELGPNNIKTTIDIRRKNIKYAAANITFDERLLSLVQVTFQEVPLSYMQKIEGIQLIINILQQETVTFPVQPDNFKSKLALVYQCLASRASGLPLKKLDEFPGLVESSERVVKTLEFSPLARGQPDVRDNEHINRWQPTGLYAAPGETITIKRVSGAFLHWDVKIGSFPNQIPRNDSWYRYPLGFMTFNINKDELKLSSPAGGLIYLQGGQDSQKVGFEFSNVAEALFYVKGNKNISLKAPAPLAQIVGENFILTTPRKYLKDTNFSMLADAVEFWDLIFSEYNNITGFSPNFKEHIVVDIQAVSRTFEGQVLSYIIPIAPSYVIPKGNASYGDFFNITLLKSEGIWAIFRLMGQKARLHLFIHSFSGESIADLLGLYFSNVCCNILPFNHSLVKPKLKEVGNWLSLSRNKNQELILEDYSKDPDKFLVLNVLIQKYFKWGVFRDYFRSIDETRTVILNRDDVFIDEWLYGTSLSSKNNLFPYYEFFRLNGSGWNVRNRITNDVGLKFWMLPNGEEFLKYVERTYSDSVRRKYFTFVSRLHFFLDSLLAVFIVFVLFT